MLSDKGSKLFSQNLSHYLGKKSVSYLCGNGSAIVSTEVRGNLTASMNELSTVWHKSGGSLAVSCRQERETYDAHVPVDCLYSSICVGKEKFGGDELLNSEDHAIFDPKTNGRST